MREPRPSRNVGRIGRRMVGFAAALHLSAAPIALTAWPVIAHAQPAPAGEQGSETTDQPVLLNADELTYDRDLGIVTARGHVEAWQGDRILRADVLTYNQRTEVLTASGNVALVEPTGEVVFADYVELTGDMRNGIVHNIRLLLTDNARMAATGGRRIDGETTVMNKAVYSPCELCKDDPSRPPLWQIKAVRVVHSRTEQTVTYEDAWLELGGIPVFYTPYFQHYDPSVRRRSGLLPPVVGGSTNLGLIYRQPYFWEIGPDKDATIEPIFTTEEGVVMAGEYRQRFDTGALETRGSITRDSARDVRGHIDAFGRLDVSDTWRTGFDVERASDDTYLRRYFSNNATTLTSRLFAEGFSRRSYASVEAFSFQGLRETDDPGRSPLVLPLAQYHLVGQPQRYGQGTLDVNVLSLTRGEGPETRRLSFEPGWALPFRGPWGDLYTLTASLRADVYSIEDQPLASGQTFDGTVGRLVPQIGLNWRYPLVKHAGAISQIIEPVAAVYVSPYGGNSDKIPNEDSRTIEFDDTNLFSENRFAGLDRIETGPRFAYGLRWRAYGRGGGSSEVEIGQSYRLKEDTLLPEGSGLSDNLSDIVGKIQLSPSEAFDFLYRFRLDKETFATRREELTASLGPDWLRLNATYIFFDETLGAEFPTREEAYAAVSSRFARYWTGTIRGRYDLDDEELRAAGLGLIYSDECLTFLTEFTRDFARDRDFEPEDRILFRVIFKTLGEFQTGLGLE